VSRERSKDSWTVQGRRTWRRWERKNGKERRNDGRVGVRDGRKREGKGDLRDSWGKTSSGMKEGETCLA
jgi:hypothetical protein